MADVKADMADVADVTAKLEAGLAGVNAEMANMKALLEQLVARR